jgi:hypothetical protein
MPQQIQQNLHNSNKFFIQCTLHFIQLTILVATLAERHQQEDREGDGKIALRYTLDK